MQRVFGCIVMLAVILTTAWITGSFTGAHSGTHSNTHSNRVPAVLSSAPGRVSHPDGLSPALLSQLDAPPPPPAAVVAPGPPRYLPKPSVVNPSDLGGAWACIREKESSGNYQSHSGPYYGAYQFDRSTWVSNGGDPNTYGNATPAEQDRVAQATQARRGWSPWPNTSRMCRLR